MFVEYLFEVNPTTFLLIMVVAILITAKFSGKSSKKKKKAFDEHAVEYRKYVKIDEKKKKETILVMSYNIMAYNFTKIEWFPYCSPEYLHPKYRAPRILNEIERVDADIICLQECDHDLFLEYYKVNLEALGYQCEFKLMSTNRIVTNVIAYKKKLFKNEKFEYLDLNEELERIDESFQKHKEAFFLTLKHYATGKNVVIVNTHLFWNPDYEYVKYGQVSKIINFIEKNYGTSARVIFCGDLNSLPGSNVLKYIYNKPPEVNLNIKGDYNKNKKYIEQFWDNKGHQLQLRSAYDISKVSKNNETEEFVENHPDFTTYTHEFIGNLDYIIYTKNNLEVAELLRVPTSDPEVKSLKIPNYKFPSDHLKIGARFILK
jgi:CCR4-NOT transcription complex subunit 6